MKVHFIGIGGIGLSALARFLNFDGHEVCGSDMKSSPITKALEEEGIKVFCPQDASNIKDDLDLVIYSAAVTDENPELIEARLKQIRTLSRKEALPIILGDKKNYCVAGAHGKSTTTAMLASILGSSALIGAISKDFGSNFRYVNDLVAFEADESDASFLLSNPYCAIVTNAEPEHMEYYHYDYDKFYESYEKFLSLAKKRVVNAEDKDIAKLKIENAVYLYPSKDIKNLCYTLKNNQPCTKFDLKDLGTFEVWGFGFHMATNASLAILAALNELDIETIRKNLLNYKGIKKRFDIVQANEKFVVIDDYAHHPTEIEATMKSIELYDNLTNLNKRIVLWQPHKYSRTSDNLEGFKKCFRRCDELIILPIWTIPGEKKIDIDFQKEFAQYNPIFADKIITTNGKIELIKDEKIIKSYDEGIFLGVGAGDITYQLRYK
ncbi:MULTISPECIES: UDP-N-acetylmuramate--L-alanine ligase [Arcobacter]|mgnify:CR=1 FL=1|uniref:UDP-N-acetylmuramate--L-alanine ligase n=1 Tax=Arcobacter ellisii TaxID=913109 RepID=A0A347U5E4_9BACT|nr:UDP-N-acetylmuramate--L-alanine ligase [Arcobacter ellisii]AXX94072.1 UDP-N-acetylmuramate-alanine ligase [Arcobacter ellisii]MBD3829137.1 UDP-N-acetylmuramate--L-alanine ligase [Arcobacter sp.]RXI32432.1 UDP-N-acetylmuramate--L-alanine ligase [Arcobacter ellisii]